MQPKSNGKFLIRLLPQVVKFLATGFGFKYFHYSAAVPIGLQTCAKMLQMHLSGGGGTPWMQPKSNGKFKLVSLQLVESFWLLISDSNIFIIVAVFIGLQACAKMLQMHLSGGGGTPWMQPKSNGKFKSASS